MEESLVAALDALARHEDTNGKVRLCLMDTQRALTFLLRRGRMEPEQSDRARELLRDIESLLPHNSFVFDKINFLMDAAQGFINIEQVDVRLPGGADPDGAVGHCALLVFQAQELVVAKKKGCTLWRTPSWVTFRIRIPACTQSGTGDPGRCPFSGRSLVPLVPPADSCLPG